MDAATPAVAALAALGRERFLALDDHDEPGADHSRECDYEWMLSVREWGYRVDGLARALRSTPQEAFADATALRDEILALGFHELHRCEVTAARVEAMTDHSTLGWRGRVDLALREHDA